MSDEFCECCGRRKQPEGITEPVGDVRFVPIEKVEANDYNPNKVAPRELALLHRSIEADGYTQPTVTVYDEDRDKYIIVDGFHRWLTMSRHPDIRERTGGLLPIVVIDADPEDRMASTVRHNRARGKHSVTGMSNLVFGMLDEGMTDAEVCKELGMEAEEMLRLKHLTGFAKLFEDTEYQRAWELRRQIQLRKNYQQEQNEQTG